MNAVGSDKDVLNQITELLDFGLEPIEFKCQEEYCDYQISVQLEDPTTVVFPFCPDEESPKNRIKFGIEPPSKRRVDTES